MGFDLFTIRNLATELSPKLTGSGLSGAWTDERGLVLGPAEGGALVAVFGRGGWVCWDSRLSLAPAGHPPGREPYLVGATIEKVWPADRDRLLWMRLSRPDRQGSPSYAYLVFELIHPNFQAYLFSEKTRKVLRAWAGAGRTRLGVGNEYLPPPSSDRLLPGRDGETQFRALLGDAPATLSRVAGALVGMDEIVAGALLGSTEVSAGAALSDEDLRLFWRKAVAAYQRPPGTGGATWSVRGRSHFSGFCPEQAAHRAWASVSDAIRQVCGESAAEGVPNRGARRRLGDFRARSQRRLAALRADLLVAEQADGVQRQAMALLAGLALVPRGANTVDLPDPYGAPGQIVSVDLDPRKAVQENAARLVKEAQRFRRRREILPQRIRDLEALIAEADGLLGAKEIGETHITHWLEKRGMSEDREHPRRRGEDQAHPRRYRTSTGWSVWAGRNNTENDVLSHRLAAQNDYWFHAHGYPGSHVVLRREGRKEEPCAQTLREAAAVAAFWSKGKTAKKVPVVYTLAKHVSKPKGAAPGQAQMKREKTLMVEPGLPPEEDQGRGHFA